MASLFLSPKKKKKPKLPQVKELQPGVGLEGLEARRMTAGAWLVGNPRPPHAFGHPGGFLQSRQVWENKGSMYLSLKLKL